MVSGAAVRSTPGASGSEFEGLFPEVMHLACAMVYAKGFCQQMLSAQPAIPEEM